MSPEVSGAIAKLEELLEALRHGKVEMIAFVALHNEGERLAGSLVTYLQTGLMVHSARDAMDRLNADIEELLGTYSRPIPTERQ